MDLKGRWEKFKTPLGYGALFGSWILTAYSTAGVASMRLAGSILAIIFLYIAAESYFWIKPGRWKPLYIGVVWVTIAGILITVWFHIKVKAEANSPRRLQHLARLQAALSKDGEAMTALARTLGREGRVRDENGRFVDGTLESLWAGDVLIDDFVNHYREYSSKRTLFNVNVVQQDQEYVEAGRFILGNTELLGIADNLRSKIAIASIDKCLGKGRGMELIIRPGGFTENFHGGSSTRSGNPEAELVAAYRAFDRLQPSGDFLDRCRELKRREAELVSVAQELAMDARILASTEYLDGFCQFLPSD